MTFNTDVGKVKGLTTKANGEKNKKILYLGLRKIVTYHKKNKGV